MQILVLLRICCKIHKYLLYRYIMDFNLSYVQALLVYLFILFGLHVNVIGGWLTKSKSEPRSGFIYNHSVGFNPLRGWYLWIIHIPQLRFAYWGLTTFNTFGVYKQTLLTINSGFYFFNSSCCDAWLASYNQGYM